MVVEVRGPWEPCTPLEKEGQTPHLEPLQLLRPLLDDLLAALFIIWAYLGLLQWHNYTTSNVCPLNSMTIRMRCCAGDLNS